MKVCAYSTATPLGKITRMGILLDNDKIIDPNLCWRAWYEAEGRFNPIQRADAKIPFRISKLLNTCDPTITALQEALD